MEAGGGGLNRQGGGLFEKGLNGGFTVSFSSVLELARQVRYICKLYNFPVNFQPSVLWFSFLCTLIR